MSKLPRIILLLETSRAFGRDLLTGIARYSRLHGPWSFFREPRGLKSAIPHIENWDADGIIMRNTAISEKLLNLNLPVITVLHYQKKLSVFPSVKTDSESIAILAARHLLNRGFKNFAYCGYSNLDWSDNRRDGFINFLKSYGYSTFVYHQQKKISLQKEQSLLAEWIKKLPKPVGIMTCNDDRGQHILEACKIANLHVPEEVTVIGVDNDTLICDLCDPPLTSIALNTVEAGYQAAQLMDKLMSGEKMDGQQILVAPTHVVKRHSTDIMAVEDQNVVKALSFINGNYREKITVNDVVQVTSLSRRSLETRIKKLLGRSIMEEVRRIRIDQMSKLLIETDMSISEITASFNFIEAEHISRYFRKEKSMSMREFRNRLKNC